MKALALVTLLGCGGVRSAPDEIVVILPTGVSTVDPRHVLRFFDVNIGQLVHAGLTAGDGASGTPQLDLAESIEHEGPGRYLVTIRPDARFPDGAPVEADDVVYTYRSIFDPAERATVRSWWEAKGYSATTATAIDARRVRFTLPAPLATFETDLFFGILSRRNHLGTGPFQLARLDPDRVEMVPNPYWIGGPPRVRRVTFKVISDAGASLLALAGGSADVMQEISPLIVDAVAQTPGLRVSTARSMAGFELGMNCEDRLLSDVRVRRAIAMAIDRGGLMEAKYHGRALLASSMLNPDHWAHADVALPRHDPAAARALLASAGAIGAHLVLKVYTEPFVVSIARAIAAQLREVGLDVEVRAYESGTIVRDMHAGNVQLFVNRFVSEGEPDILYTRHHSSMIPSRDRPSPNFARYRDALLDELLERARHSEDKAERKRIYADAQRRIAERVPRLPLWHPDTIVVTRRELYGYEPLANLHFCSLARAFKLSGR